MFKKFISMAMIVVFCLICCACGGADNDFNGGTVSSIPTGSQSADASSNTVSKVSADATLTIKVKKGEITKFKSNRPYDNSKEDISLILVTGQSNFTTGVGYSTEYRGVLDGKIQNYSEVPVIPQAGTCYSSNHRKAITSLSDDRDMFKLCDTVNQTNTVGGVTPSFGIKWNELTGTKVVFVQCAVGSVGVHHWTPNPDDYTCECGKDSKLYQVAVDAYKASYEALSKNYNIVYAGYIWNQGEHEETHGRPGAQSTVNSNESYYAAYKSMHDGFMKELGLDFGGISVVRADKAGKTAQGSMSLTTARGAQYKLCNDIDNLFMISTMSETCSTDVMDQTNTIHYSQMIFNKMGVDCADNLYKCLGLSKTPNEFGGIQLYGSIGMKLAEFDKDGKPVGDTVIPKAGLTQQVLAKNSVLCTNYRIAGFEFVAADGTELTSFVNEYGAIDWASMTNAETLKLVEIKCVIE